jgi:hypothetical protein
MKRLSIESLTTDVEKHVSSKQLPAMISPVIMSDSQSRLSSLEVREKSYMKLWTLLKNAERDTGSFPMKFLISNHTMIF